MGQIDAAKKFAADWNGRGNEDADCIPFWFSLLNKIFGITDTEKFTERQHNVSFNGRNHKIDFYIPSTKVLIEQKSFGKNLNHEYLQSDGISLTPFQQALRYAEHMDFFPRWIVTCNFSEFHVYYMRQLVLFAEDIKPVKIKLENFPNECHRFKFLVDPDDFSILEEVKFSNDALAIIDKVYNDFKKYYLEDKFNDWREYLYKICIRLVFCFYADDSRLFDDEKFFVPYLQKFKGKSQIEALKKIFAVLDTPLNLRTNIDEDLNNFPYVNGGLFKDEVSFPKFWGITTTPLADAFHKSQNFHWEKISPPVFGSLFESSLRFEESIDSDIRRQGGMHYTSEENILKVINPLFLDDLRAELLSIIKHSRKKNRLDKLKAFQDKIASLTFLDPACGSGNFLTKTFLSLRQLENDAIREMKKIQSDIFQENLYPVKVSIKNFFGIEIHAYAAAVAQVAMWIANLQMLRQTENIILKDLKKFPLDDNPNIICANALQLDWAELIAPDKLSFIIGNPPFVGGMMMTSSQKSDMWNIWGKNKGVGEMDYVSAWYKKTLEFIKDTKVEAAFVSTNSITQGQQALTVWKPLNDLGLKINFAYRTFKWISDSYDMAAVHCVIIGFALKSRKNKFIYDDDKKIPAQNINSYLLDAPQISIDYRSKPLCDVPPMHFGSMPRDGGKFIIQLDDIKLFKKNVPEKFIRPYIGAEEFLKGKNRWCLWLKDFEPKEFMKYPMIVERVNEVKNFRLNSKAKETQKFATTPHLFCQIAQPSTKYILVPSVSSENRRYIPIGFVNPKVIASNATLIIPNATLYHFGVLTSSVHMAWTKTFCGRLKSDFRYSKDIVYNNFVWCTPTAEQKKLIEKTAQKILDVRADYGGQTLAYLYNEATMPKELRLAHKENDAAVMAAYGFSEKLSEGEIVAELMKKYRELTT